MNRRTFLQRVSLLPAVVPAIGRQTPVGGQSSTRKPPCPYVDGLSCIGTPSDVAQSGLSAFINDVSTAERLATPDGSIKYFRSFEACDRSINAARKQLADNAIPGAFLATSGSAIKDAFAASGYSAHDLDWFVPHQANRRIIDGSVIKLGLDPAKVIITVDKHGNTSAASIPLALCAAIADGRIKKGDLVMFEAMGGGFTWGASLIRY